MEEVIHDDRSSPAKKDPRKIARKYQLELCEKAVKENIIVCLGTGCGKTHIAVLLMNELRHQFTKPKKEICIFLAPTVPLVQQQAVVIENSIDLKVQSYFGHVKHLKTHADWENDLMKYEVFVMTPIIFLQSLRHCHIRMELVALLIFDECHHAQLDKRHDYTQIMKLFYNIDNPKCPRVFGMTASPIFGKGGSNYLDYAKYINSLENILNARICSVDGNLDLEALVASPAISIYYYTPVSIYDSKFMLVYMEELEANKNNLFSILRDNYTDLKVLKNKQKSLSKVHGDVIFCLENVGLWGAVQIEGGVKCN
ncbi:hypothetical protein ZOSMA_299G00030 [Zostera marina]|uniref:Helicase ATP-binding domain-containing protein n=1 Tax=Zostera marina TaxID=29655 RepID=A0A0K9PBQ2_ZOSMR|nr:hypothetical protein ZOSMA_299G00030 [Zostera marina]